MMESTSEHVALGRFWRRHGLFVAALTLVWGAVTFLPPLLLGWGRPPTFSMPLATLFMAELVPVAFVAIAWLYASLVDALDADYASADS